MGPFPHDAPKPTISKQNPVGTDGFEFVEFSHPDPEELRVLFTQCGFKKMATHYLRKIEIWQQGDVTYLLNADQNSFGGRFVEKHGPCAPSMGWRVADAQYAYRYAISKGAKPYIGEDKSLDVPAIYGIGDSLIYFIDRYGGDSSPYADAYDWSAYGVPEGLGLYYVDHLTHNVFKGNMDKWFDFYGNLFNFHQLQFFDIEGKHTGLYSRALSSPCGKIRIPINEDRGETGQIVSYLKKYNGEGIQHIALGARDIYEAVDGLAKNGIRFMPAPPQSYYDMSHERLAGHQEPVDALQRHGILLDGEGVANGGETKLLLQIFSKTIIGPIFFEFIQRKGDDGFGEGNFKALFESIEQEQLRSGEITVTVTTS